MRWRPLPSALFFAIAGPLIGAGLVLLVFAPAIANLGPFDASAPLDLLFGAFVIGLPPMAATKPGAGISGVLPSSKVTTGVDASTGRNWA